MIPGRHDGLPSGWTAEWAHEALREGDLDTYQLVATVRTDSGVVIRMGTTQVLRMPEPE
jgi:hypothetical protein